MRVLTALTFLAILLPGALVQATGTIVAGTWTGAGWVAFHGNVADASAISFEVRQEANTATVLGISLSAPAGGALSVHLIMHGHATEVSSSLGGLEQGWTLTGDSQPNRLRGTIYVRDYSGPMQMLVWDAGARGAWHWNVSSDVAWTEIGRAQDAYFWSGEETAQGLHVKAAVEGNGIVASDATYDLHVAEYFWGLAGRANPSQIGDGSTITLTRPNGFTSECPCWPREPGDYKLEWQGIDVDPPGGMPILLAGVDVPKWIE